MRRAVCPGSCDPVTNGHLDIIGRVSRLFDEVIVGVLVNESKKSLFTIEERLDMLREVTKPYENVRIEAFQGLTVDFCRAQGASARPSRRTQRKRPRQSPAGALVQTLRSP